MAELLELPHTAGCLVCGRENPHGLHLSLGVDPASGVVSVPFTPRAEHIGFVGVVHGGALATILDEAMVWAASWVGRRFCVCAEMSIRFRERAQVGADLLAVARVESMRGRLIQTRGEITAGGKTLASATGKYMQLPIDEHTRFCRTFVHEPATLAARRIIEQDGPP